MFNRIVLMIFDGLGIGSYVEGEPYNSLSNALWKYGRNTDTQLALLNSWGLEAFHRYGQSDTGYKACYGRTRQQSVFCDSYAAHWEMAGKVVNEGVAFHGGVPERYLKKLKDSLGISFSCNRTCYFDISLLTEQDLSRHKTSRQPLLLTIPENEPISTVCLAALDEVISFDELKVMGEKVACVLENEREIGRIVVKSLSEAGGKFFENNKRVDFTVFHAPEGNLLDKLTETGVETYATGKVASLFNGRGLTDYRISWDNQRIFQDTLDYFHTMKYGLLWVNFNSLDRPYGHNGDVESWVSTLIQYNNYVSRLKPEITGRDLLIITGDHGCDPCGEGRHTREWNPLLVYNPVIQPMPLGDYVHTDIGKTIAANFGICPEWSAWGFLDKLSI